MQIPLQRALWCLFVFLTASGPAVAEQFVCRTVRPGDTAAEVALRWTGDAESRHQAWFQVLDPTHRRVVPKARYGLILPGWQACIATSVARTTPAPVAINVGGRSTTMASSQFGAGPRTVNLAFVGWALLCFSVAILVAWPFLERRIRKRQVMIEQMKQFGDRFVEEFEWPLIRPGATDRPIKSQTHLFPDRRRLDILLAPSAGRTYPNLSDHRKNVEYDIERILQRLGEAFISGPPHTQGAWVAIPFQFRADTPKEGVV